MNNKYAILGIACLVITACDNSSDDPPAANVAPVIGAIADRSSSANMPSPEIYFTVTDESPDTVMLTVMSDNQAVVADDAIVLAGSDDSRSLTITPTADTLGDALITISVTDSAGLASATSFLLTITPEQKSLQSFTRTTFAASADGEPELINAVEFSADAEADDFADLLAQ